MSAFEEIYLIVKKIPRGRVATYGQISQLLGRKYSAQFVGWAMHGIPAGRADIPWHRVVNAQGGLSRPRDPASLDLQRQLLVVEGLRFDVEGRLDLAALQWDGKSRRGATRPSGRR